MERDGSTLSKNEFPTTMVIISCTILMHTNRIPIFELDISIENVNPVYKFALASKQLAF